MNQQQQQTKRIMTRAQRRRILITFDPYITYDEIKCKCGCNTSNISMELLDKLFSARMKAMTPFRFTSMCRCPEHNKKVGGSAKSSHLSTESTECKAADIRFTNGNQLLVIVKALLSVGFRRIGINKDKGFIHVDMDSTKPQDILFFY